METVTKTTWWESLDDEGKQVFEGVLLSDPLSQARATVAVDFYDEKVREQTEYFEMFQNRPVEGAFRIADGPYAGLTFPGHGNGLILADHLYSLCNIGGGIYRWVYCKQEG